MEFCKCICQNNATKEGNRLSSLFRRLRDCLPLTEVRLDENKKRNRNMKNGLLSLTFIACLASSLAFADIHVSLCQGEKDSPEARFGGARTGELWQNPQLARVPPGAGSCLRRTGHPFTVSDPCGPSQKIECVFTASPETIRREPREFDIRRSVGNRRTWQSARCVILLFFPRRAAVSKRLRSGNLRRVRSRVARDPRRADTPPSSGPRLTSLDWHFPSVFLSHRPRPDYDPVWVPASRLPPAHAGYVCCAVWKAVYASLCQRSSI